MRSNEIFRQFSEDELTFVSGFKTGELAAEAGTSILAQGSNSAHVFTVLSGWGMRYMDLDDGRRQILNFVFPGELIGLQGALLREMDHGVQAITDMMLCVFERSQLWTLYERFPSLAYDITWLAAREEMILDNHLLSIGRRSARERLAYLVLHIFERARPFGLTKGNSLKLPLTQQHIADTLGLSLVHTNKTLKRLHDDGLLDWKRQTITIRDMNGLKQLAGWEGSDVLRRPLI